jgi:hypothetical protein
MIPTLALFATASQEPAIRLPLPPPMPRRAISPRSGLQGETLEIEDGNRKYTLFLPTSMQRTKDVSLTIHFHSAIWHAIQEHLDRGLNGPLIAFYPGEGSSIYGASFADKERLGRWMKRVLVELRARGFPSDVKIASLDISSFSAGYGAVRELVKDPGAFRLMRRVVLGDSMYGSLVSDSTERMPVAEHIDVWVPLAKAAMRGEKTFAVTFSQVPTPTYASSSECAAALVEAVGGKLKAVEPGTLAATLDSEFPLRSRFDSGSFHVWGYGGEDGQAHMTHARHLADVWMALDLAGEQ